MPIANAYKEAVQHIINKLNAEVNSTKPRRHLSTMFLETPDPSKYPDYYTIITEPRSINGVQEKLQKNRYRNILDVLNDLYLVFANALHYNEASSQISKDAAVLKDLFEKLWKDDPYLPNAQPTKQPGRKPGFRAAPLPRMSSFVPPMRSYNQSQTSYSTALATVQLKPVGKAPVPTVAPRLQPLKKRKKRRTVNKLKVEEGAKTQLESKPRRAHSPAFSEIDFTTNVYPEDSELEVPQAQIANDVESDAIVKRLENSLPLWEPWGIQPRTEGADDGGWMHDFQGAALQTRLEEITTKLKTYHNSSQQRPIIALEEVPTRPDPYSTHADPLAWATIVIRVSNKQYSSGRQFEKDLFRLFEKARRYYTYGGQSYGWVLACQRIANLLTSPHAPSVDKVVVTMSSVPGPRRAQPVKRIVEGGIIDNPSGTTSYDVLEKGKSPMSSFRYKGVEYHLGEFVHLSNPEDISKPIVAQIWACWTQNGSSSFTACWYLHPEQTVHSPDHPFYENEVVKTGLYVDYMPEDVIEKVCIQFYPHYFTGRPRPPHWYPGWPIYVCEQRYDDRNHSFLRISKPELCFPPSLRQFESAAAKSLSNSLMRTHINQNNKLDAIQPVYPFERLVFPLRKSGPNAGPRISANLSGPTSFTIGPSDAKESASAIGALYDGGRDGRGRPRRMAAVKAASAVGAAPPGSPGGVGNNMTPGGVASGGQAGDRTIVSAAGGGIITSAMVDKLPNETTQFFDRDPTTNEMLWFSGAPIDVARTQNPRYSLDYLYQLALKGKRKAGDSTAEGEEPEAKRTRRTILPTASEVWYDVSVGST